MQTYYEINRSVKNTFRNLRASFGRHGRPSEPGIRHVITRFEETGSVEDRIAYEHARPVRSHKTIAAVSESARDELTIITRHRLQQLNISRTDCAI